MCALTVDMLTNRRRRGRQRGRKPPVIVELRTSAQAERVASLTGGSRLPGKPRKDGSAPLSRKVDVGPDFECHRASVESVTVLFKLCDGDAASCTETGEPGRPLPTGWTVKGARFEVEWPSDPGRAALVRSHFGARRFAYNWGLARVKADMDVRKADPGHEPAGWDLVSLRNAWNQAKNEDAPWWKGNSKEAYSCGLADLSAALGNWRSSKNGERKGRKAGFPKFRSRRRDEDRVRFTTGAMRLEADRRTITLPVIGGLRSKENTRHVQRHLAARDGRLLNVTLSERLDRRAVHLRKEAAHQLTAELTGTYGEVVIEDLDIAAMKRGMGRRAFRRSVSDAALGRVRPMLAYKAVRTGTALVIADRWFPSSQYHHGHVLPDGTQCRLAGRHRLDKHLTCPVTGEIVDRDHNAARNLRDWPDLPVGAQLFQGFGPSRQLFRKGGFGDGGADGRRKPPAERM